MSDATYEVKQSKKIITITFIAAGIFGCLFIGLAIYFLIKLCGENNLTFDENVLYIFSVVIGILITAVIVVILVYLLYTYKNQIDVYTEYKLIRKKGDKIIFELPYENIALIKQGHDSIFLFLNNNIIKTNGKKGPRNFYEHYSRDDIYRIKQIILNRFNIKCQ